MPFIHFFWYPVICGVASVIGISFLRGTYAPVIRQRRAAKYGDNEKALTIQPTILKEHGKPYYIWINLSRPVVSLFGSLICFVLSLYLALWVVLFSSFSILIVCLYSLIQNC